MDVFEIALLQRMRGKWRATIEDGGGNCPCCDRWGRIYPRTINETMARSLIWLCEAPTENGWVNIPTHAPRWLVRSNQLPTLRYWDLVERAGSKSVDKKYPGLWRPTELGRVFARDEVSMPKTVYTYNGQREKYGDEVIRISDCFGSNFSYKDLMR
jgi:hypothetical protein